MTNIKTWAVVSLSILFLGGVVRHSVGAPSTGYKTWIDHHAVSGNYDEDDDNDGHNNLLEYALGGDPQDSDIKGFTPNYWIDQEQIEFTYLKRNDDPDLTYHIETSSDLVSWTTNGTLLESDIGSEYDAITETVPCSEDQLFLRLRIDMNDSTVVIDPLKKEAEDFSAQSGLQLGSTRESGGRCIMSIDDGDWAEYTVNIPKKGLYYIAFRIASIGSKTEKVGQIDLSVAGKKLGSVSFSGTRAYHVYKTVRAAVIFEQTGEQTLRLDFPDGGFRIEEMNLIYDIQYGPGAIRIQAENYDAHRGGSISLTGQEIESIGSNHWFDYEIDIPQPGHYELLFRVAPGYSTVERPSVEFGLKEGDAFVPLSIMHFGNISAQYTTLTRTVTFYKTGPQTVRILSKCNKWKMNWFQFQFKKPLKGARPSRMLEGFAYLVKDNKSHLFSSRNTTAFGTKHPNFQSGGYDFDNARLALLTPDKTDQLMDITGSYTDYERKAGMGLAAFIVYRTPATLPNGTKYLLSNGDVNRDGFSMAINGDNRLQVSMGSGQWLVDNSAVLQPNTTYVLAATYNAHVDKLSVYNTQGKNILESAAVPEDYATGLPLLLGGKHAGGSDANGTYYEVRLYDRVVSTQQIEDESAMLLSKWGSGSSLEQHLTAEELDDFVLEGNRIEQWTDRSGNKQHALANTSDVEYIQSFTSAEKARGASFQGSNDSLLLADVETQKEWLDFSSNGNDGLTVVLAFNPKAVTSGKKDILGNAGFSLGLSSAAKPFANLGGTELQAGNSLSNNEATVYTLRYNKGTRTIELWNASNEQTVTQTLAPSDFSTAAPLLLGASGDFDGDIYEVIVYSAALSDEALAYQQKRAIRKWKPALRPVEVIGHEGYIDDRYIYLDETSGQDASAIWLQVNNLAYQNKGSIKINEGDWLDLNHETVGMHAPEKAVGGMTHGGYNTIRFKCPSADFKPGLNRIQFRFNEADAISLGYRIVNMDVFDANGESVLSDHQFVDDDPDQWVGPFTDEESIKLGRLIWYGRTSWPPTEENRIPGMVSNYKAKIRQPGIMNQPYGMSCKPFLHPVICMEL